MPGFLTPHKRTIFPEGFDTTTFKGGSVGQYWVEISFHPQPFLQSDEDNTALQSGFIGDSHLIISEPLEGTADRKYCFSVLSKNLDARYYFYCNKHGRLSHVNVQLHASTFDEAANFATTNLNPLLAGWAARFNVPIYVFRLRVLEENTQITRTTIFHQQYPRVSVPETEMLNKISWYPDDTRLMDLYREGLNTSSPKYQFLCYFAVIDLAMRLRIKRTKAAVARGELPVRERELFVQEDWFTKIVAVEVNSRVIGKKLTVVWNDVLKPIRNSVAHALLAEEDDDSALTSNDDVYPYLPVAKRLAEHLLSCEFGDLLRES